MFVYVQRYNIISLTNNSKSLYPYYGTLLGHSTDYVRDFAAKAFSVITRKLTIKKFKQHFNRIIKLISWNLKDIIMDNNDHQIYSHIHAIESKELSNESMLLPKKLSNVIDGVTALLFYTCKGVKGCFHSKGTVRLKIILSGILSKYEINGHALNMKSSHTEVPLVSPRKIAPKKNSETQTNSMRSSEPPREKHCVADIRLCFVSGVVAAGLFQRIVRHVRPCNAIDWWSVLIVVVSNAKSTWSALLDDPSRIPLEYLNVIGVGTLYLLELIMFGLNHSNGRGLCDTSVRDRISWHLTTALLEFIDVYSRSSSIRSSQDEVCHHRISCRFMDVYCSVWKRFHYDGNIAARVEARLEMLLHNEGFPVPCKLHLVKLLAQDIYPLYTDKVAKCRLVVPLLRACVSLIKCKVHSDSDKIGNTERSTETEIEGLLMLTRLFHIVYDIREDVRGSYAADADEEVKRLGDLSQSRHASGLRSQQKEDEWEERGSFPDEDGEGDSEGDDPMEDELPVTEEVAGGVDDQGASDGSYLEDTKEIFYNSEAELVVLMEYCLELLHSVISSAPSLLVTVLNNDGKKKALFLACTALRWLAKVECDVVAKENILQSLIKLRITFMQYYDTPELILETISALGYPLFSYLCVLFSSTPIFFHRDHPLQLKSSLQMLKAYIGILNGGVRSISCLWAVLEFTKVLCGSSVNSPGYELSEILSKEELSNLLEGLTSCLFSPSYWIRTLALRIAAQLPPEELLPRPDNGAHHDDDVADSVHVAKLCLEVALTTPAVQTEREYARRMGKIEVIVRGGRLSSAYVKFVCNFSLGILYSKFKPFWEPAVLVMKAAADSGERGQDVMWPQLLIALERLGCQTGPILTTKSCIKGSDILCVEEMLQCDDGNQSISAVTAQSDAFYFLVQSDSRREVVYPDGRTDTETMYSTVWDILRRCPSITLRRSKAVVPMFLR